MAKAATAQPGKIAQFSAAVRDGMSNLISGLGTSKDKSFHSSFIVNLMTRDQVEAAFRGDWIARKGITIPADDSTRAWRSWQADNTDITKLEEAERVLGLQSKLRRALIKARLYGGGALVMGVATDTPASEELVIDKVKQGDLQFIHAVSRWQLTAGELNRDMSSPFYGQPTYYERSFPDGRMDRIHPSRVVRLIGAELPDEWLTNDGWGESVLQALYDAVRDASTVQGAIATMVQESKFDIVRMDGLSQDLSTEAGTSRLITRMTNANTVKSIVNTLLLDKMDEWERVQTSFQQLPEIMQMYLMIASASFDVPATRFLSQSPAGMNATGESDVRNYYDNLSSKQNNDLTPALSPLDEVMIRSALGSRPDDLFFNWNPLWQLSDEQKSKIAGEKAKVFQVDLDSGLFSPTTMREARANQLIEDSTYPGFEQSAEDDLERDEDDDVARDPVTGEPMAIAPDGRPVTAEPQKEALNGTQITSLREIVEAVAGEQIPPDTAKAMLTVAFPTLGEEEINAIIDPLASFEPKADPIELAKAEALKNPQPMPAAPGVPAARPRPQLVKRDGGGFYMRTLPLFDPLWVNDATPRTLYVRRDVVNVDEIAAWFKTSGLAEEGDLRDDLHVTIAYSDMPLDWMKVGDDWSMTGNDKGQLIIKPGGVRLIERMGPEQDFLALLFVSSQLSWRHEQIKEAGAAWNWPEYQPHVTLFRGKITNALLKSTEPYRGRIVFSPEIFEEVKP